MLTEDPLHFFTFFDLVDIFSLECVNSGIELKQVNSTCSLAPSHAGHEHISWRNLKNCAISLCMIPFMVALWNMPVTSVFHWANVTALFDDCRELIEHCQKFPLQLFKRWITVSSRFKAVCFRTYISELYKPQFSKFTDAVVRGPRL